MRIRQPVLTVGLTLAVVSCMLVCSFFRIRVSSQPTRAVVIMDPAFVEWCILHEQPDNEFRIKVTDRSGGIWYRKQDPDFNLANVDYEHAFHLSTVRHQYCVHMAVQDRYIGELATWSHQHIGSTVGIFVEGKLVVTEPLIVEFSSFLSIINIPSIQEAERLTKIINSGGVSTDTQPNRS
jgi:hypothetical protein